MQSGTARDDSKAAARADGTVDGTRTWVVVALLDDGGLERHALASGRAWLPQVEEVDEPVVRTAHLQRCQ